MSTATAPSPTEGTMMIGPHKAGKTTLLATLELASRMATFPGLGRVGAFAGNEATEALFDNARMIGEVGYVDFPGTIKPERYVIELRYKAAGWLGLRGERNCKITVIDGRGGDLIGTPVAESNSPWGAGPPDDGERPDAPQRPDAPEDSGGHGGYASKEEREKRRKELVQMAAGCRGLIVCVDANDPTSTMSYFGGMNQFLRGVSRHCGGRVPFDRVAIVMTKADRLVQGQGPRAMAALLAMDAARWARKLISDIPLSDLFTHLSPAARERVYCGWASVYGFIPEDGSVNFIPQGKGGRLAVYSKVDAGWINRWRPHLVLDPFVYTATGNPAGLTRLPQPDLASH